MVVFGVASARSHVPHGPGQPEPCRCRLRAAGPEAAQGRGGTRGPAEGAGRRRGRAGLPAAGREELGGDGRKPGGGSGRGGGVKTARPRARPPESLGGSARCGGRRRAAEHGERGSGGGRGAAAGGLPASQLRWAAGAAPAGSTARSWSSQRRVLPAPGTGCLAFVAGAGKGLAV